MRDNYTVYLVPHTHWDREWYAPFQHFRIRLVQLIDRLLALLERDPNYTHFSLDGQSVVLQDYLEIRPENRERLQQQIRRGRIGVGPWYVLPDEFLVSGESLIRNLQMGHRIATEYGRVQKVGYIPDTFGHISQLPQILRGFGINNAMHFRGLDETGLLAELWWRSPDGSCVLLRHLPTYAGYTNAAVLSRDLDQAIGDLQSLAREEARRATTHLLLAMNGVDHMEAREDVPELVRRANERSPGLTFVQGSLEGYMDALEAAVDGSKLQVVCGELRDTNRTPNRWLMRVLPNILSSRIYIKMQNQEAQTWLERWAEPWSALMWTQGEDYPAALLWKAWEWLLQNHPHDSIGGCSVDPVHSQMETRFAWAVEIAEMVTAQRFHLLANQIDLSGLDEHQAAVILYNGLAWDWDGVVSVDMDIPVDLLRRWAVARLPVRPERLTADMDYVEVYRWRPALEWGGSPPLPDPEFRGLTLRSLVSGEEVPLQIESRSPTMTVHPLGTGLSFRQVVRVRASFPAHVPPYGYAVYAVRPEPLPNPIPLDAPPLHELENEFLRVRIRPNGGLAVTDKATGIEFTDLGFFEDGGDCGDGYTYSYPAEDQVFTTWGLAPNISRLAAGPVVHRYQIDYEWTLPAGLDETRRRRQEARVHCPLSVVVSLAEKSHRVELQVTFENRARDHRLRMVFPSDLAVQSSCSETQFDVVTRPVHPRPVPRDVWIEDPPATYPQLSWMDISDGTRGLCLINQGLPEYQVLDSGRREVAITLLRAVGWLAAGPELQTAVNGAGPTMPTPEGQVQRTLTFRLAIHPHTGKWDEAEVWRQAHEHNVPPRCITVADRHPGNRPAADSLLRLEGSNIILSAVKRAENLDGLIVRAHNPSCRPATAWLTLPWKAAAARQVDLDESVRGPDRTLPVGPDGRVALEVAPGQILTVLAVAGAGEDTNGCEVVPEPGSVA